MIDPAIRQYPFDLINRLRIQGFTEEAINIFLTKFLVNYDSQNTEDKDPSEIRYHSFLSQSKSLSKFGFRDNLNEDEELKGITIFNWDKDPRKIIDPEKTMFCDLTRISYSLNKIFNMTSVVGSISTIKEYIADGDYQINIEGTFSNDAPDIVPVRSMQRLNKMVQHQGRIALTNDFLNNSVGIMDIIIESYDVKQSLTGNIQEFSISGVSDLPDPQT